MVKVEEGIKGMDRIEGRWKALLKKERNNKEETSKKLTLVIMELDEVKADLDNAQKEVELFRKQAADSKDVFKNEGYNLGKQDGYDLGKEEGVKEFVASAKFARNNADVAAKAVEDFKSSE